VTLKGKPTRVIITGAARKELDGLNNAVDDERRRGITKSDRQTLLRSIEQKVALLKDNPEYGTHIPKDRIPKEYVKAYEVSNLWKVNLSGAWRMLYTVRGSDVEIIALILDIVDHGAYDKKFGYRRK